MSCSIAGSSSLWSRNGPLLAGNLLVLAGAGGGRQSEQRVSGAAPAAPGPLQVGEGDDGLVAVVLADRVLTPFPVPASGAERSHGGGVAAAFGGEVTAVAEHVRPSPQRLEV